MQRVYIKDLKDYIGKEVTIAGWVDVRRDHGKLIFIDLRDMSGKVQMVALPNHEEAHKIANNVRNEWVVEIKGQVNERPERMKKEGLNGELEVEILETRVLSEAKELPFEKDTELNLDTYLDYLPLTLRTEEKKAVFKVQTVIVQAFRDFLIQENFTEFQAPKIIGADAEGGAGVFELEYFENKAFLATSPQFYKQIMVGVFEKVFSVGNVFRAEKHNTTRHINEYTSLDFEMGFIEDHHDMMETENKMLKFTVERLKEKCQAEFNLLNAEIPKVPEKIPFMKLKEAQEIIKKEFGEDCVGEPDLEPQHERWLCEYAKKEFNSDFIFVTHYPVEKRPMYTYEDEEDPGFTKSFDLLFRGVEITTGGQRIHNYDKLVSAIKKKGLDPEKFSFYLQAFKYGIPPHGGIGMGLERLTAKFLGIKNIKEATLFPREINRIDTLLNK
ncbi:aspartate--tRNA(Asn) ligase [Patescibacteria group bacterium]|nr:aspartate--tRNA(Asn) ligase [Patescibacteria group bacterium]MCG2694522.1 aspartate--tRNA(Asn) ligase [Candidatus Parcubacteria bacterium]